MSLDPPKIMLERTFLQAVTDDEHEHHEAAVALYLSLLDEYEREELLLVAVSDHLRAWRSPYTFKRTGTLAPVDALHVGHQHRRVARRAAHTGDGAADFDVALTLTMCDREHVRRIATFDERFRAYDLVIFPE